MLTDTQNSENKRPKIDENVRMTRSRSKEQIEIRRSPRRETAVAKSAVSTVSRSAVTKPTATKPVAAKIPSDNTSYTLSDNTSATTSDNTSATLSDSTSANNSSLHLPLNIEDPFQVAKRAFHRSGNFKIIGRVEEKAELTSFWYDRVESGRGGGGGASIYISGNPGTGKTALVDELIPELINGNDYKMIKINCMMLKDPLKAFQEIAQSIKSLKIVDKNPYLILNSLEQYFCNDATGKIIVIIDEIDQIGMKDPELLCKLLAMPYLPNSKVFIFGIANSIDLTERFLPRLKLLNCEPVVLHFPQYTVPDITAILCDRLERINAGVTGRVVSEVNDEVNSNNKVTSAKKINNTNTSNTVTVTANTAIPAHFSFIDKSAIELTARKVASTGDLRRALDILRQAIDLAEDEYKLSTTKTKNQLSGVSLVKLSHVVKIMEKFGSSQSGPLVLLKSLNLHQKVILSAIVGFPQEKGSILTIQKLFEEYSSASTRPPKLYDPVTRSEFIDLISNLESMSLIGKSSESSSSSSFTDLWKLKIYLLIPNELVKTMISQELPTIKALFGI